MSYILPILVTVPVSELDTTVEEEEEDEKEADNKMSPISSQRAHLAVSPIKHTSSTSTPTIERPPPPPPRGPGRPRKSVSVEAPPPARKASKTAGLIVIFYILKML